MKILLILFSSLIPDAHAYVAYVGNCASSSTNYLVKGDAKMQRALRRLSEMSGRTMRAYSCIRTEKRQAQLYRSMKGDPNRVGSPTGSRHLARHRTATTDLEAFAPISRQCKMMDQVRTEILGGVGGVATYSGGDAHFDVRGWHANWNKCAGVLGRSKGGGYRSKRVADYRNSAGQINERSAYRKKSSQRRPASSKGPQTPGEIINQHFRGNF